jgi:hyperosmotically inducible protein
MDTRNVNRKTNRGKVWVLFVLLAFAIGTVGSSAAFGAPPPPQVVHHSHSASFEKQLKNKLYDRLVTIPWYNVFDNLEYKVQGSKVTLSGQVVFPLSRSLVAGYVRGMPGVTHIVNHIQNLPISPLDNQIRWAEYRALFFGNSPLFHYSQGVNPRIHIIVNNGRVTLVGVVGNKGDREIAGIRAREVPDVFSVKNKLKVV